MAKPIRGNNILISVEAVADALDGHDKGGVMFEFFSQLPDMHVHRPGLDVDRVLISPNLRQKDLPRQHAPFGSHQGAQKFEFFGSDLDGLSF